MSFQFFSRLTSRLQSERDKSTAEYAHLLRKAIDAGDLTDADAAKLVKLADAFGRDLHRDLSDVDRIGRLRIIASQAQHLESERKAAQRAAETYQDESRKIQNEREAILQKMEASARQLQAQEWEAKQAASELSAAEGQTDVPGSAARKPALLLDGDVRRATIEDFASRRRTHLHKEFGRTDVETDQLPAHMVGPVREIEESGAAAIEQIDKQRTAAYSTGKPIIELFAGINYASGLADKLLREYAFEPAPGQSDQEFRQLMARLQSATNNVSRSDMLTIGAQRRAATPMKQFVP